MLKVIFSGAFRPLFLLVGIAAPVAIAIWLAAWLGLWSNFGVTQNPLGWHMHEMLFGVIGAAVGGFLFTAVANWTGRTPLHGGELALLVCLWLFGRLAMAPGVELSAALTAVLDLAYLACAAVLLARELYLGGNRRNYVILVLILLLLGSDVLYHATALGWTRGEGWGVRAGSMVVILLISVIGGRIIPAFTRNWIMLRRLAVTPPAEFGRIDAATIGSTALVVPLWMAAPYHPITAAVMVLSALLHAVRLSRWRGHRTVGEPLLLVLHVAYAWIPIGLMLLGISIALGAPSTGGVHALTVGAMTTMIMAVSARAALGHSGRPLTASPVLTLSYLLITLAAVMRVTAATTGSVMLTSLAGTTWIAAFAAFVAAVGPVLVRPRVENS